MNTSPNGIKAWELAKRRFYILLDGVDRDILRFFKSSVISVNKVKDKPQKALKELCSWNGFLNRPSISKALSQ